MRTVEIPGGTADFREQGKDEIPGRSVKLMRAAAVAAASELSSFPELFEPGRPGETDAERTARLAPRMEGVAFSTRQAMAWDNVREATVVALLKTWTLDRSLPTLESIGDLPDDLYDALLNEVGGMSAADIEVDFSPPDRAGLEESPTGPSSGSDMPLRDEVEMPPTPMSSNDGESTDTAVSIQD
jgi:hypothetical protein